MTTTVRSSNSSINEATFSKSFSLNPRVVSAGVPREWKFLKNIYHETYHMYTKRLPTTSIFNEFRGRTRILTPKLNINNSSIEYFQSIISIIAWY